LRVAAIAILDVRQHTYFYTLQKEVAKVIEGKTEDVRAGVDPETGREFIQFQGAKDLGLHLGLIVGDVVHNLRTALDHLVHQLAVLNGTPPFDVNRSRQFPVSVKEAAYLRKSRGRTYRDRCLIGVKEEHRKRIDAVQPYHYGEKASRNSLALLSEVDNADKHRVINTTVAGLRWPDGTEMRPGGGPLQIGGFTISGGAFQSPEEHAAGRLILPDPGTELEMDVGRRPTPIVLLGYDEMQISIRELDKIGRDVDGIVRWFKPYLWGKLTRFPRPQRRLERLGA